MTSRTLQKVTGGDAPYLRICMYFVTVNIRNHQGNAVTQYVSLTHSLFAENHKSKAGNSVVLLMKELRH